MFNNLKKIAYLLAKGPPKEIPLEFKDLLLQAKTYLAFTLGYLLKDPIWDQYTEEELIIEFFALQFFHSKEFSDEFINSVNTKTGEVQNNLEIIDDFSDWADAQIEKNKKELEGDDFEYIPPHLKDKS